MVSKYGDFVLFSIALIMCSKSSVFRLLLLKLMLFIGFNVDEKLVNSKISQINCKRSGLSSSLLIKSQKSNSVILSCFDDKNLLIVSILIIAIFICIISSESIALNISLKL